MTPSAPQKDTPAPPRQGTGDLAFSILMPTWNCRPYIARALDSVLSQPGADFEILVVDDGSTDATRRLIAHYGPQVRYLRQNHAGVFAASRTGFRAARGRFIIPVDADDRLHPGALAALRAAAQAHPQAKFIFGRSCTVLPDGRKLLDPCLPLPADPLERFKQFACGRWRVSVAGALIHRDIVALFDRDDLEFPHGTDLAILGRALLQPCVALDDLTLEIHVRPGRLREDAASIYRSQTRLVDLLFDPQSLPPAAMAQRSAFLAFVHRERTRAFHRAGWHGLAWRSFAAAVRADIRSLADGRNLRRACTSALRSAIPGNARPPARLPRAHWLYGHHRKLWGDAVARISQWAKLSSVVQLRLRPRTFLLTDPADVCHILQTARDGYAKTGILRTFQLLAGGMIGLGEPEHRAARRPFAPAFKRPAVPDFAPLIVATIDRHLGTWPLDAPLDVAIACKQIAADLAARMTFGPDDEAQSSVLLEMVWRSHLLATRNMRDWFPLPRWAHARRERKQRRVLAQVDAWLLPRVAQRRSHLAQVPAPPAPAGCPEPQAAAPSAVSSHPAACPFAHAANASTQRHQPPPPDLLTTLLIAQPEASPASIRDQALTLFIAGFEPVSVTLPWALQLLAENPAVAARIGAELSQRCGTRTPAPQELSQLPYLAAVVQEVLRLYPSEWLFTRRALTADLLPSGLSVRAGEELMVSPYLMQRDERFFPDPERFDPDRFLNDRPENAQEPPPPGTYFPFGMGSRVCLGEWLARLQLALFLAHVVQRFRVLPVHDQRPQLESTNLFSTQPKEGHLLVRLHAANPAGDPPQA